MLKQITLERALELMQKGSPVPVLIPGAGGDWTDRQTGYLDDLLSGVICFEEDAEEKAPEKKERKPIDMGKVHALQDAGWAMKEIALEMGVSVPTLVKRLKEEEPPQD